MKKHIEENTKNNNTSNGIENHTFNSKQEFAEHPSLCLETMKKITGHAQFDTIAATYENIEKK